MTLNQDLISAQVAALMDATLLKPTAVQQDILNLCSEARSLKPFGVCVSSSWLPLVAEQLRGSSVKAVAVVGFPTGTCNTETKVAEAQWCEKNDAGELDMVAHLGLVKGEQWEAVAKDIEAVVRATKIPVKVILESQLLEPKEIIQLCKICDAAGAAFVKTSTGWEGGARLEDVKLMAEHFPRGVKASGGIRTWEDVKRFVEAGATRIGTSSCGNILTELQSQLSDPVQLQWFENNPLPANSL